MSGDQVTDALGGWKGYRIDRVRRQGSQGPGRPPQVWIELEPLERRRRRCSGCGCWVRGVHDVRKRIVRDLPIFEAETWLIVPRYRLSCPRCGPKLESLEWLARYSRVTRRLAESVARLCAVLPIKHVAEFYGLAWNTVKAIDKNHLLERLGPIDVSGVDVIALDEIAIHRGQRYATIVVDPKRKRVLWVGHGRGQEDVRPFFELLGEQGRRRIRAAVIDMWDPYEAAVRSWCPQAEIVFDHFHVAALYGREVVDRVRIDEANRLRGDPEARRVIKGSRWLLLRRRENLPGAREEIRLRELLEANENLMTVYVLKEDLARLWEYHSSDAALRFFQGWAERALESGIGPLIRFVRKLQRRLHGILAHCRWPLNNGLLEGMSNKIKVIKRMAYGFRDDEYFFLKIRAAFPGIRG